MEYFWFVFFFLLREFSFGNLLSVACSSSCSLLNKRTHIIIRKVIINWVRSPLSRLRPFQWEFHCSLSMKTMVWALCVLVWKMLSSNVHAPSKHMTNGGSWVCGALAYKNHHCIHAAIGIHFTLVYFPLRKLPHARTSNHQGKAVVVESARRSESGKCEKSREISSHCNFASCW